MDRIKIELEPNWEPADSSSLVGDNVKKRTDSISDDEFPSEDI